MYCVGMKLFSMIVSSKLLYIVSFSACKIFDDSCAEFLLLNWIWCLDPLPSILDCMVERPNYSSVLFY